jgi:hypothetical protein
LTFVDQQFRLGNGCCHFLQQITPIGHFLGEIFGQQKSNLYLYDSMNYSKIRSVNSGFFEASTPELEAFLSSFGVLAVELPNADSSRQTYVDSQGLRHGLSDDAGFIKFGQGTREH